MSYKSPVIPELTLKGLSDKVQTIQLKLADSLSWLSKSFGLAERIVELRDNQPYVYPAVFEGNTIDPVSMMPTDAWSSFCFWVSGGEATFDFNNDFPSKNPIVNHNVSCIFYMDINIIDDVFSYKGTKSKITEDIFHFFNTVNIPGRITAVRFIEDDLTKIYDGFSLEQVDNKFLMYPKWGCRIDFELSFRYDCYTANTYTGDETGVTGYITCDMDLITVDNG